MSGFTACAPATYPASNFWISGASVCPPRNPIVSHAHLIAAAAPTRNEPSCSLNVEVRDVRWDRLVVFRLRVVEQVGREPVRHGEVRCPGNPATDRVDLRREREPDADHDVEAGVGECLDVLAAVGTRGVGFDRHSTLSSQTRPSAIACCTPALAASLKRLVAQTADVERDTDLEVGVALRAGRARGPCIARRAAGGRVVLIVATCRCHHHQQEQWHGEPQEPYRACTSLPFPPCPAGYAGPGVPDCPFARRNRQTPLPWETTQPEGSGDGRAPGADRWSSRTATRQRFLPLGGRRAGGRVGGRAWRSDSRRARSISTCRAWCTAASSPPWPIRRWGWRSEPSWSRAVATSRCSWAIEFLVPRSTGQDRGAGTVREGRRARSGSPRPTWWTRADGCSPGRGRRCR